jgi:hypothetical protein
MKFAKFGKFFFRGNVVSRRLIQASQAKVSIGLLGIQAFGTLESSDCLLRMVLLRKNRAHIDIGNAQVVS